MVTKKIRGVLTICVACMLIVSFLVVGCPASEPAENIVWRADCHLKSGQIWALGEPFEKCISSIYENSGGRLKIEPHWSAELGLSYSDFLKNLQSGLVEISALPFPSASKYVPDLAYSSISYMLGTQYGWPDLAKALKARRPIYDDLLAQWNARFLVEFLYLPDVVCGTDIISTKPIYGVEDLNGISIRCTSPQAALLWEGFGAKQVAVDTPEIYTAVKTGMVDSIFWSRDNLLSWKLYEVCPYLIEVFPQKEKYFDFGWGVSLDAWNKLPKDLQKIVTAAFKEYQDEIDWQVANFGTEFVPPKEAELEQAMKEWNVTIIKFPAADQALVLEAADAEIVQWLVNAGDLGRNLFRSDMEAMGQTERYNRIMQLVNQSSGK